MKKTTRIFFAAALLGLVASCGGASKDSNNTLVILHTNDTHSQIEPGRDMLGGVQRRMAVIDSIRNENKNVLLVDAGDAVQGTLYFYLYGGEVEQEVMNIMGVDMRILGNHEFDNGIDSLAAVLKHSQAQKLSTNYDFSATPLEGMFQPYSIREIGGKKIAFLGINLDPDGIISPDCYKGLVYEPLVAKANLTAKKLKEEQGVDAVIALSHIGYNPAGLPGDSILATNSRDIDIIIGGHSHDTIDPNTEKGARRSRLKNLEGEEVLVVQTGKSGRNLGKIEINLDSLGLGGRPRYELIKIDSRFDGKTNAGLQAVIDKYRPGVDSLMHQWIGSTDRAMPEGDQELVNFFSDYVFEWGNTISNGVDLAIANKGGLRTDLPEGKFSKGHIINMVPFRNYIQIVDVKGADLLDVFEVMASTQGNGVSKNVEATYRLEGGKGKLVDVKINGKKIDPAKTYRVATIDYLANGGDYMTGLTKGKKIGHSDKYLYDDLVEYFVSGPGKGKVLQASKESRWKAVE